MTTPHKTNPFSTRFTRPDAVEFLFEPLEDSVQELIVTLAAQNFIAQIVGPHGSGKTTLTFAIERGLEAQLLKSQPSCIRRITIRDNGSIESVTDLYDKRSRGPDKTLLIIDGIQRLSLLQRLLLVSHCKNSKIGLLLTTHRRLTGIPVLFETTPKVETLNRLVKRLAPDLEVRPGQLTSVFERSKGNIRESLMMLYDELI